MMKPHKIKKYIQTGLSCFVLLSIFCSSPVQAGNDVEKKRVSSITLDWEEFRSLLRLDADEVKLSWDEFNRLMVEDILKEQEIMKDLDHIEKYIGQEILDIEVLAKELQKRDKEE